MTDIVEQARAAARLGLAVRVKDYKRGCSPTVSINGQYVGVVSRAEGAELEAFVTKLKRDSFTIQIDNDPPKIVTFDSSARSAQQVAAAISAQVPSLKATVDVDGAVKIVHVDTNISLGAVHINHDGMSLTCDRRKIHD